MDFKRRSGVLLHPTSLPGKEGIGTLGKSAYDFIDWLKASGQTLWQILPLGPTGYGDSPYASFSTFAGNPLLIDLDMLVEKGWYEKKLIKAPDYIKKTGNVDFGAVVWWKMPLLKDAASYFLKNADKDDIALFKEFCREKKNWLDTFATFMSIKAVYDKKAEEEKPASSLWNAYWPKELASCDKEAISLWQKEHKEEIEVLKVVQFFFDVQWTALKKKANENGILLIGDIPIFVAVDSADVWGNQKLFQLDKDGRLLAVAGVPPDYFSADGQLWGNPLYDWDAMKADKYSWWVSRIKRVFELTDVLRIDHFRGFEAYWSVPAGEATAINGKWVKGPGIDLFNTIKKRLGDLPVIAEDLGVITDEVKALRDNCGFPGMKVLQFAFSVDEAEQNGMVNYFLPHTFTDNKCVIYTGTHDNETMQGWLENLDDKQVMLVASYIEGHELSVEKSRSLVKNGSLRKDMIRTVFASTASYAIIPMQDILGVGNEGRMNMPSTTGANWTWRMENNSLKKADADTLAFLSKMYGRNIKA
ncbi:MAG: 4-alpha-glucanotransferase [Treponema sp.]|nr:4-alpha-glucanotransferase [Treponema sp.]